jgi:hypothetical protein
MNNILKWFLGAVLATIIGWFIWAILDAAINKRALVESLNKIQQKIFQMNIPHVIFIFIIGISAVQLEVEQ